MRDHYRRVHWVDLIIPVCVTIGIYTMVIYAAYTGNAISLWRY